MSTMMIGRPLFGQQVLVLEVDYLAYHVMDDKDRVMYYRYCTGKQ